MTTIQIIGIILMLPAFGWFIWGMIKFEDFRMPVIITLSVFGFITGILMLLLGG